MLETCACSWAVRSGDFDSVVVRTPPGMSSTTRLIALFCCDCDKQWAPPQSNRALVTPRSHLPHEPLTLRQKDTGQPAIDRQESNQTMSTPDERRHKLAEVRRILAEAKAHTAHTMSDEDWVMLDQQLDAEQGKLDELAATDPVGSVSRCWLPAS
jgi:hypothetical protein